MKKIISGNLVQFTFGDDLAPVIFDATKAHATNRSFAELFGWSHRIGDYAAISRNAGKTADGKDIIITVTEAMRRAAVLEIVEHYHAGGDRWEMREATRAVKRNPLWEALAAKRGVAYEIVEAEKVAADLAELAALGG